MTHVLIPLAILEGQTVSPGLRNLLSTVEVTVLGYHEVPEQTPPDQARHQFEDRAVALLEDICQEFREVGGDAERRLVFTHDREKTVDRVADEIDADATVVVRPTPTVDEVYIAIDTPEEVPLVSSVAGAVVGDIETDVLLRYFSRAEGSDDRAVAEAALAELADGLVEAGMTRGRIDSAVRHKKKAVGPIVEDANGVDIVVLSEPALSIGEFLLGDIEERIAAQLLAPVLVVRREKFEEGVVSSGEK